MTSLIPFFFADTTTNAGADSPATGPDFENRANNIDDQVGREPVGSRGI